jgi:hypothetical protein
MDCNFEPEESEILIPQLDAFGARVHDPNTNKPLWVPDASGAREAAYETRYVTLDGSQIDLQTFLKSRADNLSVFRAAYVGVTYQS